VWKAFSHLGARWGQDAVRILPGIRSVCASLSEGVRRIRQDDEAREVDGLVVPILASKEPSADVAALLMTTPATLERLFDRSGSDVARRSYEREKLERAKPWGC
jgi:hypothetical protein